GGGRSCGCVRRATSTPKRGCSTCNRHRRSARMSSHVTCPGCQTLLTIPGYLAGKVARCPRCKSPLPTEAEPAAAPSGSIPDRPAHIYSRVENPRQTSSPDDAEMKRPDARVQLICDGCRRPVTFPSVEMGTVQECPQCGEYLDVPDLATERY